MVGREGYYGSLFLDEEHDIRETTQSRNGSTQKATNREALGDMVQQESAVRPVCGAVRQHHSTQSTQKPLKVHNTATKVHNKATKVVQS